MSMSNVNCQLRQMQKECYLEANTTLVHNVRFTLNHITVSLVLTSSGVRLTLSVSRFANVMQVFKQMKSQ